MLELSSFSYMSIRLPFPPYQTAATAVDVIGRPLRVGDPVHYGGSKSGRIDTGIISHIGPILVGVLPDVYNRAIAWYDQTSPIPLTSSRDVEGLRDHIGNSTQWILPNYVTLAQPFPRVDVADMLNEAVEPFLSDPGKITTKTKRYIVSLVPVVAFGDNSPHVVFVEVPGSDLVAYDTVKQFYCKEIGDVAALTLSPRTHGVHRYSYYHGANAFRYSMPPQMVSTRYDYLAEYDTTCPHWHYSSGLTLKDTLMTKAQFLGFGFTIEENNYAIPLDEFNRMYPDFAVTFKVI